MISHATTQDGSYRSVQAHMDAYDWSCAFTASASIGYDLDRIAGVLASVDGENDESSWCGIFIATDGKFIVVNASCDYTGWDCQSGSDAWVCDTIDEAISVLDVNNLVRMEAMTNACLIHADCAEAHALGAKCLSKRRAL